MRQFFTVIFEAPDYMDEEVFKAKLEAILRNGRFIASNITITSVNEGLPE